ncbi:hypothetical protein ACTA71_005956 [Dictyostelium dimigraforme]
MERNTSSSITESQQKLLNDCITSEILSYPRYCSNNNFQCKVSLLPSAKYDSKATIVDRLQYLKLLWSIGSISLRVVTVACMYVISRVFFTCNGNFYQKVINEPNGAAAAAEGGPTFKIIPIQENQFKIYLGIDKFCKDKSIVITKKKNYEELVYKNDPFLKKVVNNIIEENHKSLHGYSDQVEEEYLSSLDEVVFKAVYFSTVVGGIDKDGGLNLSNIFKKSRLGYSVSNIIFQPIGIMENNGEIIEQFDDETGVFNTFVGINNEIFNPYTDDEPTDWRSDEDLLIYFWHLYFVWARCNVEVFEYILSWFGCTIYLPNKKKSTMLIGWGVQGCGKSSVAVLLGRIFGDYHLNVQTIQHITGQFNAHTDGKLLATIDEVAFTRSTDNEILKSIITNPKNTVTQKCKDTEVKKNLLSVLGFSNDYNLPINERRYVVCSVSKMDFKKFGDGSKKPFDEHTKAYAETRKILNFNRSDSSSNSVQNKTLNVFFMNCFLKFCISRGGIYSDSNGDYHWPQLVIVKKVKESFTKWARLEFEESVDHYDSDQSTTTTVGNNKATTYDSKKKKENLDICLKISENNFIFSTTLASVGFYRMVPPPSDKLKKKSLETKTVRYSNECYFLFIGNFVKNNTELFTTDEVSSIIKFLKESFQKTNDRSKKSSLNEVIESLKIIRADNGDVFREPKLQSISPCTFELIYALHRMFIESKRGEKLKIVGDASIPEMNIPDSVRYNHSYVLKYKSYLDGKISLSDYLSFNCNNDIFDDDDHDVDDVQESLEKPLEEKSLEEKPLDDESMNGDSLEESLNDETLNSQPDFNENDTASEDDHQTNENKFDHLYSQY